MELNPLAVFVPGVETKERGSVVNVGVEEEGSPTVVANGNEEVLGNPSLT